MSELDIDGRWLPKQAEATRAADSHGYVLFGGSRGPGKSYWLRWWLLRFLLLCFERGIRNVRVGLFCETYPVLIDRQVAKIEEEFPAFLGRVRVSKSHGFGFHLERRWGGGVIALRNLDDPNKFKGAEFAAIGVDQIEMITEEKFNVLRASKRWPLISQTRFVATANPGGIGHAWVKALWIDRQFPPYLEALKDEFVFIRALPDDNKFLPPEYWQELNSLPPALARAWRYGEWDIFAGQAFPEWRRDAHVIEPCDIPAHWIRIRAIDWGYRNPFCCLWAAKDPDTGRVVVYREAYQAGLTDRQQARLIKEMTPLGEIVAQTYADPSMWTRKNREDTTFSSADEYRAEGVVLTQADNDRLTGARKVRQLLSLGPDGKPLLQIFSTCTNLIRTLPALPYAKNGNPEDVDSEAEDHAYDALRYLLTRVNPRPVPTARVQERPMLDPILKRIGQAGLLSKDF